ncbi:hypothetical protein [Bacillus sp. AFS017274]|uniref:hypothetical protein n=1 Tax=Bacillus sp. AFS017274 TaxID=2033488 RepID=UPI000BFA19F9|nr:hypothetical protein [Bacillus sp. AFS017274]PEZ76369.1 hypothetical protein CN380_21490 [Bacillus sp. AFS017274]
MKPNHIFNTIDKFILYLEDLNVGIVHNRKVVRIIRDHYHLLTLFDLNENLDLYSKEKSLYVLKHFLKEKFKIPYEQQLIFE